MIRWLLALSGALATGIAGFLLGVTLAALSADRQIWDLQDRLDDCRDG